MQDVPCFDLFPTPCRTIAGPMPSATDTANILGRYRAILAERFGYPDLRPQQENILSALEESDVFAVAPTGSGKSMTYVLPALLRGRTLVVSPHIALMQDQVEGLRANGVEASFINSTLTATEKRTSYFRFRDGHTNLLYTSPESLANRVFVDGLARIGLNLLAIDEAHCVSEWGHTFRPDYLRLNAVRNILGEPRTLALTATATIPARADIVRRLGLHNPQQVIASVQRFNLSFSVERYFSNDQRRQKLADFVSHRKGRSGVVYVSSRARTEELAELLSDNGVEALAYHAGLESAERRERQRAFMTDRVDVMVATNAFGLGVDKPDIRYVVHYDMPRRIEAYYQEAGRAGRDGEPAECVLFYSQWSRSGPEYFIEQDHPNDDAVRSVWSQILGMAARDEDWSRILEDERTEGLVMAMRALQESGLVADDGMTLWSMDSSVAIRTDTIQRHRQYELEMLDRMVEFATTTRCRMSVVLRYFGEPGTQRCGKCDNCAVAPVRARGGGRVRAGSSYETADSEAAGAVAVDDLSDDEKKLFDRLREWRKARADSDSVPPYVVFHDRVLAELARRRPTRVAELSDISGIGAAKREKYGREVARVISGFKG